MVYSYKEMPWDWVSMSPLKDSICDKAISRISNKIFESDLDFLKAYVNALDTEAISAIIPYSNEYRLKKIKSKSKTINHYLNSVGFLKRQTSPDGRCIISPGDVILLSDDSVGIVSNFKNAIYYTFGEKGVKYTGILIESELDCVGVFSPWII